MTTFPAHQPQALAGTIRALAARMNIDPAVLQRFFADFAASDAAGKSLTPEERNICALAAVSPGDFAAHQVATWVLQGQAAAKAGESSFYQVAKQVSFEWAVSAAAAAGGEGRNMAPEALLQQMGYSAASIAAMKKVYLAKVEAYQRAWSAWRPGQPEPQWPEG